MEYTKLRGIKINTIWICICLGIVTPVFAAPKDTLINSRLFIGESITSFNPFTLTTTKAASNPDTMILLLNKANAIKNLPKEYTHKLPDGTTSKILLRSKQVIIPVRPKVRDEWFTYLL